MRLFNWLLGKSRCVDRTLYSHLPFEEGTGTVASPLVYRLIAPKDRANAGKEVTAVNGQRVRSIEDMAQLLCALAPRDTSELEKSIPNTMQGFLRSVGQLALDKAAATCFAYWRESLAAMNNHGRKCRCSVYIPDDDQRLVISCQTFSTEVRQEYELLCVARANEDMFLLWRDKDIDIDWHR